MDREALASLGSQRQSRAALAAVIASSLITAVLMGLQYGLIAGSVMLGLGIASLLAMVRNASRPCYTIEADALVQHLGAHERRLPWATLRRPVRRKRVHFEDWLVLKRGERRLLLPLAGLTERERERLLEVVRVATAAPVRAAAAAAFTDPPVPPVFSQR